MNLCYTERNKECYVGFFSFLNNLSKSLNKKDVSSVRSGSKNKWKQDIEEDLDDLDFDEMNDVWDELDDM